MEETKKELITIISEEGKEEQVEESIISKVTTEQFGDFVQIKKTKNDTAIDNVIRVIAFIFDMNFKPSFQILKEEDYINKILNRYNFKDESSAREFYDKIKKESIEDKVYYENAELSLNRVEVNLDDSEEESEYLAEEE